MFGEAPSGLLSRSGGHPGALEGATRADVQHVADGTYLVRGSNINWGEPHQERHGRPDRHRLRRRLTAATRLTDRRRQSPTRRGRRADRPRPQRPPGVSGVPARDLRHPRPATQSRSATSPAGVPVPPYAPQLNPVEGPGLFCPAAAKRTSPSPPPPTSCAHFDEVNHRSSTRRLTDRSSRQTE
jgi:hypothetical protein